jgi:manganese efflux pump family protein
MAYLAALGLAVGLALDTAAVAAARAVAGRSGLALPWLFGAAHALMATIGWLVGRQAVTAFAQWDHWIAFVLLVVLGGRMIVAPLRPPDDETPAESRWELAVLAVATSIDALAAGLAIDAVGAPPAVVIALIGSVCVAVATAAVLLGRWATRLAGRRLSRIGGIVLIAVAVRIVILHTT